MENVTVTSNCTMEIIASQEAFASPQPAGESLCSSTRFEACALIVGCSIRIAEVYERSRIRWTVCKRCGIENKSEDETFESELVLGVDCCLVCSAAKQQRARERMEAHHSIYDVESNSTYIAQETLDGHTTNIKSNNTTIDGSEMKSHTAAAADGGHVMTPIPESEPQCHTRHEKLIIGGRA